MREVIEILKKYPYFNREYSPYSTERRGLSVDVFYSLSSLYMECLEYGF